MRATASVVFSVYNATNTLEDALDSLIGQSYKDLEIIAVDDKSTDDSLQILKRYANSIRHMVVLENTSNLGISRSLNKAIDRAQGTYIVRMDADDICLLDRVATQICTLTEHPEIGCVSCYVEPLVSLECWEEWNRHPFETLRRTLTSPNDIARYLPHHNVFHGGEMVFEKSLWQKVGGYRPEFIIAEDYDLWLRMIDYTQFFIVPQILYIRRFHTASSSSLYKPLMDFLFNLVRKSYSLRQQGFNDRELIQADIAHYISSFPEYQHFLERLSPLTTKSGSNGKSLE